MYQLSIITLLFGAFVIFCLGMLLNYWISNRNKVDYKSKYEESEKDLSSFQKKIKKAEGNLKQTSENRDMWRQKAEHAESKLGGIQSASDEQIGALRKEVDEQNVKLKHLSNDLERAQRDKQQVQDKHNKLVEKYSANNKENKEWSAKLEKAEKDKDEYKHQWGRAHKQSKDLSTKLETQTEQISQFKEVNRELRRANTKNKKLSSDLAYWEQKHFDTHHELASLRGTHETVNGKLSHITDLRNGDQVMMDNMRQQLEEYKKKYIDVNHKYKELTSTSTKANQFSNS